MAMSALRSRSVPDSPGRPRATPMLARTRWEWPPAVVGPRGGVQAPREQRTVGHAGERVGVGELLELGLQGPSLGDVEEGAGQALRNTEFVGEDALVERHVVHRTVGVLELRVVDL